MGRTVEAPREEAREGFTKQMAPELCLEPKSGGGQGTQAEEASNAQAWRRHGLFRELYLVWCDWDGERLKGSGRPCVLKVESSSLGRSCEAR